MTVLVKICGITSVEDGLMAIEAGADLLGIILVPSSKRYINEERASELIERLCVYKVPIVAVTVETNYKSVASMMQRLGLVWVQVLAPKQKKGLEALSAYHKLLVVPVESNGSYHTFSYSLDKGDYWLYDRASFGKGETFDWKNFHKKEEGPFFIAGGLNPENVSTLIEMHHPQGVDVASGVAMFDGIKKDRDKMHNFIRSAK